MNKILFCLILPLLLVSCTISYKFNGASIDYSKVKSIDIRDFRNQASRVYPPLVQTFNEHIKDVYTRNTKLIILSNQKADLELEGEIVRYDLTPLAVKEDAYAGMTRLTMAVKIRYINNVNPNEDKEETFSSYQDFESDKLLDDVQDQLIDLLIEDIVDQIFNATMSNW
ncbi:LPS assembly lipoprotein LptE [Dysgonomonas sp. OttesenSCG-928-M03]|nr:LPS assembly lipoprotein LptE [Dysgonomonas sp. OttesenSCG-928-M03]